MNEAELKKRLEKALLGPMTRPEWRHLKRTGLVSDYANASSPLDRKELRDIALLELNRLRSYSEDVRREESGGDFETENEPELGPSPDLPERQPDSSASLSKRTFARASALSALNLLRARGQIVPRALIHGTTKPRGGVDGTVPQWVIFLAVEAWVPAEEVKDAYRVVQRNLLAEKSPPKTQERAFDVARFVWEQDRLNGRRLPWRELWEHWNSMCSIIGRPDNCFPSWRAFHTTFSRGERATRPRYFASEEQLTKQVRTRAREGLFDSWVSSFHE